ncbi:6,7-dimethyl-8-ribityllumazine synthase [Luteimonas sp. BDR2-5]|uniref:6,7-dimethyl-8-ribityllumazine synthase n=1 Tax=Proluteimonas luteida TaxID=2878685 RepID=UPI001E659BE8|nr:6,7-dimethyl-8-ribityllumazine synthase [Luteimonas sp. BDR2-5]MCD9027071.1 6,7-dimethyl-8-ribityllumazine synthase [Luteimonas sp. BDR2-5]
MSHFEGDLRAPDNARFAIIASRWNPRITDTLVAGARKAFSDHGVAEDAVDVIRVPGAWEIPLVCGHVARAGRHAAILALGCVVRGDTRHYEQVADGCSDALMRVALDTGVPVANGVLAVEDYADAEKRAGGSHGNKGEEAAIVAIEMSNLLDRVLDAPLDELP